MAGTRDEDAVAAVVAPATIDLALEEGTLLTNDLRAGGDVQIVDADLLQGVGGLPVGVLAKALAQADGGTRVRLVVAVGEEEQIAVEDVHREGQFAAAEPRLRPGHVEVTTQETDTSVRIEALATATEVTPVTDVEIRLRDADEAAEAVDRAEARAEVHGAGGLLGHGDVDVLAVRRRSRVRAHIHVAEVVQLLEAGLAHVHFHRVQLLARGDRQLAADDFILRHVVAGDVDAVDVELRAFGDRIHDLHLARTGIEDAGVHAGVGITAGAVVFLDHLLIRAHLRAGVGEASLCADALREFVEGENRVSAQLHAGHVILLAFHAHENEVDAVAAHRIAADFDDLRVGVAAVLHSVLHRGDVFLHVLVVQLAGLAPDAPEGLLLRFQLLTQLIMTHAGQAFEDDVVDQAAGTLVHLENDGGEALAGGRRGVVGHVHVRVALFLIHLADVGGGGGQLDLIHSIAHARLDLLAEAGGVEDGVAGEMDVADRATARDDHDDVHAIATHVLRLDVQILDRSRAVERADVTLHRLVKVGLSGAGGHLAADAGFIQRGSSVEADDHVAHDAGCGRCLAQAQVLGVCQSGQEADQGRQENAGESCAAAAGEQIQHDKEWDKALRARKQKIPLHRSGKRPPISAFPPLGRQDVSFRPS